MREIQARRRLLEEETKNVRQQRAHDRVETGHLRLALIQRFVMLGAMLISFALALFGSVNLALVLLVAGGLSGWRLGTAGTRLRRIDFKT